MKNVLEQTQEDKKNFNDLMVLQFNYIISLKLKNYLTAFTTHYNFENAGDEEKFKNFILALLKEARDVEFNDFELAYTTDMLYLCQVTDTRAFADFLWRRWCEFKSKHMSF
jgi:hypothetical protein